MTGVKKVRSFFVGFFKTREYEDDGIIRGEWVSYGSHTASFFEYKGKVCYMECSWRNKQGIYTFTTWKKAVDYFVTSFINNSDRGSSYIERLKLTDLFVYEYFDIPEKATDAKFIDSVMVNGKMICDFSWKNGKWRKNSNYTNDPIKLEIKIVLD